MIKQIKQIMTQEEQKEQVIQGIADMMRRNPFSVEFKVVKKPKGIKVIYELTQEEMDLIVKNGMKTAKEV